VAKLGPPAKERTQVVTHGVMLSSLWGTLTLSHYDCQGLLFGPVSIVCEQAKTDGEQSNTNLTTFVIQSFYTVPFFDRSGEIDRGVLLEAISKQPNQKLIGWIRFRRCSPLVPSMFERLIHRNLHEAIKGLSADGDKLNPLFLLCTETPMPEHQPIFSFEYSVYQNSGSGLQVIPLEIQNLKGSSQKAYKEFQPAPLLPHMQSQLEESFPTSEPPAQLLKLHEFVQSLQKQLKVAADEVAESNERLLALEEQVKKRREEWLLQQMMKLEQTNPFLHSNIEPS